jgi:hypothetical protein
MRKQMALLGLDSDIKDVLVGYSVNAKHRSLN